MIFNTLKYISFIKKGNLLIFLKHRKQFTSFLFGKKNHRKHDFRNINDFLSYIGWKNKTKFTYFRRQFVNQAQHSSALKFRYLYKN